MDHLQRSLLNCFSLQPLDRTAHLRENPKWLAEKKKQSGSTFYLLNNDSVLINDAYPVSFNYDQLTKAGLNQVEPIYLGIKNELAHYAVNVDEIESLHQSVIEPTSLRDMTDHIDPQTASILAYALVMNRWHLTTKYCRRCGSRYQSAQGGHVLKCSSPDCRHTEFPRINPAVIMRVTCDDKILLARQPTWPKNRYSVLAGFVEPGETLEHAVQREVMEEAGIKVDRVYYHSSQPWPFPNSLMIGYCAETRDMKLDIENDDLETAIWLDADELKAQMDQRNVILSPPISISHRLIEDWFMDKTGRSIKEWQDIKPEHIVHENE